jgi:hypothetical protein
MSEMIENFIHRPGTSDYPAYTCRDLFAQYPSKAIGEYYLDTNGGSFFDHFVAECNRLTAIHKFETCVYPKINKVNFYSTKKYSKFFK